MTAPAPVVIPNVNIIMNAISETVSAKPEETFAETIADLDIEFIMGIRERWLAKTDDPERAERLAVLDAEIARRGASRGDSEAVSEKPRPGRPAAFDYRGEWETSVLRLFPEVRTRRGRQNVLYRQRAVAVLGTDFPWIVDRAACERGGPNAWKPGILVELGRIKSDWLMRKCARFICRRPPRTIRQGERMVRRWRQGIATYFTIRQLTPGWSQAGTMRGAKYERGAPPARVRGHP